MNLLEKITRVGSAIVAGVAANARRRALAGLSDLQLQKLGIDRRSLAYYAAHGRPLAD